MNAVWEHSDPAESSSGASYRYGQDANGRIDCECRGWTVKKPGKARECKHTKRFISKHGLRVEVRGDYWYAATSQSGAPVPQVHPAPFATNKPKAEPTDGRKRFKTIAMPTSDINPFVDPMLAAPFPEGQTLENFLSNGDVDLWAMEEKFDGERKIVAKLADGTIKSWSRPRSQKGGGKREPIVFELPPHIKAVFAAILPSSTSVDGELFIPGGISSAVRKGTNAGTERFVVFDVVVLLGQSTIVHSYDFRRELLTELFSRETATEQDIVTLAESVKPSLKFLNNIWAKNGEGAILKRRAAKYQPGQRSRDCIKIKAGSGAPAGSARMVITGYKKGELGPKSVILLRNPLDNSETKVASMGGGAELVKDIHANGDKYIGRECRIEYQFRTDDGSYRHPRWDRWENE
jgi:ATP-dependent DNA ligase